MNKGFNLRDKIKVISALKMANSYQFNDLCELVDKEKKRRNKKK